MSVPTITIIGGSNLIARTLLGCLSAQGRGALVVARRPVDVPVGSVVLRADVCDGACWSVPPGSTVVSVLPLAVLVHALDRLDGIETIVAIGSTSLWSKGSSPDAHDRAIARSLAAAEETLTAWCAARGVGHTILRPTLVYDGIEDRNVARMRHFIRRFGLLPIAPPACGLRQPIHADDVAKAILGALGNPAARDRAFDIAGGEILSYRAMAERVFRAEGRVPRFLPLSPSLLEAGFRLAVAGGFMRPGGVGASVFRRMNQDLVFDVAPGLDVLGYAPRGFTL